MSSFLWRARAGIRTDRLPLFAGHGMADASYRPPRLPYVSVIGPLNVELEPERDPPRSLYLWVQTPGYLAGAQRGPSDAVPAPGPIVVRFDGDTQGTVTLDFGTLAGQPLTADGVGAAAAIAAESAVRATVAAGGFTVDGAPVTDPERLAELAAATVRWDGARSRVVVGSGRRGVRPSAEPDLRPSRVDVPEPAGAPAQALGLAGAVQATPAVQMTLAQPVTPAQQATGAFAGPGRLVRHRRPSPTAVAVDVRVDLWAGSQLELAAALDRWIRITATRGQLLERPALPAADVPHGATTIRLQPTGEPATRWTLLQLEPGDGGGLADRVTGRPLGLSGAAAATASGVRFGGAGAATARFFDLPPVPLVWLPEHPAPGGYAVTAGLRMDPGTAGDRARLLAVEHAGQEVLAVDVEHVVPGNGGPAQARLRGEARHADGTAYAAAVATVEGARLASGVQLHVVADAGSGTVAMFLDGVPAGNPDGAPAPGPPGGGAGMVLRLGDPGGVAPGFAIEHVHLAGRPLGPPDPRSRAGLAPATAWATGEPVSLARTEDGVTTAGDAFTATVVAVDGAELTLDRPVQGTFQRAATLVFARALFFSQRQLRRHDDLMNRLYRISVEYRVSSFLDERFASVSAPLVETTDVELRDLTRAATCPDGAPRPGPARPAPGHPGTSARIVPGATGPTQTGPTQTGLTQTGLTQTGLTQTEPTLSEAPHA